MIWQKIETYFIVTVLTALMWLYAEDENVKEHLLSLDVRLVSPPTRQLVIRPASAQTVRVNIRCATGQLADLMRLEDRPVELVVNDDATGKHGPRQTIVLADRLKALPVIADRGVIIVNTEPATIDVQVERIQSVSLPIRVNPGSLVLSNGQASVDPATATVSVPESLAADLAKTQLEVQLDTPAVAALDKGKPQTIELPLTIPPALRQAGITPTPATVRVTFTTQTTTFKVPIVPIQIILAAPDTSHYAVDLSEDQRVLSNVELSGPSQIIDQIRGGQITVWAGLRLTSDELAKGITAKAVDVFVPPGVTVVTPPPKPQFTIRRTETPVAP